MATFDPTHIVTIQPAPRRRWRLNGAAALGLAMAGASVAIVGLGLLQLISTVFPS